MPFRSPCGFLYGHFARMPFRGPCGFFGWTLCTDAGSQHVRFFWVDTLHGCRFAARAKKSPPTDSVGGLAG